MCRAEDVLQGRVGMADLASWLCVDDNLHAWPRYCQPRRVFAAQAGIRPPVDSCIQPSEVRDRRRVSGVGPSAELWSAQ